MPNPACDPRGQDNEREGRVQHVDREEGEDGGTHHDAALQGASSDTYDGLDHHGEHRRLDPKNRAAMIGASL